MPAKLKTLTFWRDLALYFMVFSFVGHWFEMLTSALLELATGEGFGYGIMNNFIEPYTVYGLGAVVCIVALQPMIKKFSKNLAVLYFACTGVCAIVEYVSALIIVFRFGHNPFWDYSDMPFNLNGYICLRNTLAFGVIATAFMAFIYPRVNKLLVWLGVWRVNYIFTLILIVFTICAVAYWK
ncbi:MAG: putative ABC transporter permease [Candidatus Nomurabacteria bacterium]|jgi:uncharacterized membrane protein|nr:putative ABC transporter permease [Candidatus Nomurabacteria bacterium]